MILYYSYVLCLFTNSILAELFIDDFSLKEQLRHSVPFVCYIRNNNIVAHIKTFMVSSFNFPDHSSVYIKDIYSFDLNGGVREWANEEYTEQETMTYESTTVTTVQPLMTNKKHHVIDLEVTTSSGREKRDTGLSVVNLKFEGLSADLVNVKERCNEKRCFLDLADTEMLMNTIRPIGETWGCDKLSTEFGLYWFIRTTSKFGDNE
eukprot:GAHX01001652.1.p1 GENE.GAHX01001652.1~~GAHX01001652.1.p1  ORF type:complete len:206 (-),score=31.37 GAHX01001652.1:208-825(-)